MRELELYLHIPFCVRKCSYCDFLSAPADMPVRISYVRRLIDEIKTYAPDYRDCRVSSIFLGGGTPSVLEGYQIASLMEAVYQFFHIKKGAEITMECNPGTLTAAKADYMRKSGINRISLGLQSASDKELKLLGRIHTSGEFLQSFDILRKAGFDNLNVDVMSALPGQTEKSWEHTLKLVASLRPEHISAYSLIIEEGTPFYEQFHADELSRERGGQPQFLPGEEEERRMYDFTGQFLHEKGYRRYEISNYARTGYECRHNIGYWTRENYLGLGLGASSLIENVRFRNTFVLEDYLEQPFSHFDEQKSDKNEQIEEFMFLGLRLMDGISRSRFESQFGMPIESVYGDVLQKLKNEKLLEAKAGRICLTPRGIDLSNMVLAEFLFD